MYQDSQDYQYIYHDALISYQLKTNKSSIRFYLRNEVFLRVRVMQVICYSYLILVRSLIILFLGHRRGSPIGFSGSGIWLISRPGFGILKEKGDEIRDCNYDRDTGFGDFNRRESGNVASKKPRFGNFRDSVKWG